MLVKTCVEMTTSQPLVSDLAALTFTNVSSFPGQFSSL